MPYRILAARSFDRSLRKLPPAVTRHLKKLIFSLENNPRAGYPLRGEFRALWSLHTKFRNTQYRVIYSLDETAQDIMLHYVASRENLYKELKRLHLKKTI